MIIPLDYAQANIKFTGDAAPTGAEITFGVDVSTYPGTPTLLASDIYTAWSSSSLEELYVGSCVLSEIYVKFGPNEDGAFGSYFPDAPGSGANPSVTVNSALLVSKHTPKGGRIGRGRFYLPGVPDNQADANGTVHSGYLTSATDDFNEFLGKLEAAGTKMVVLHGDPDIDPATTAVNVLVPQPKLATQRRRLRR